MTLLAYSRPFWPLFLHILSAMTLWGALLTAAVAALARQRRATFVSLLTALPAWAATLGFGSWIEGDENWSPSPTWLNIGHMVLEPGLIVLLAALGAAFWWRRSENPLAGRIVAGLAGIYLLLLTVAMLAMSGKWG